MVIFVAESLREQGLAKTAVDFTPVLGDLVGAYEFGSELAEHIETEAKKSLDENLDNINKPPREANAKADEDTIATFKELAATIKVTKPYFAEDTAAHEQIADALTAFHNEVAGDLYLLDIGKMSQQDYDVRHQQHKDDLQRTLTGACQEVGADSPSLRGAL
jgi:hypothetical protein